MFETCVNLDIINKLDKFTIVNSFKFEKTRVLLLTEKSM